MFPDYSELPGSDGLIMLFFQLLMFVWFYLLICLLQIRICKKESFAAGCGTFGSFLMFQTVRLYLPAIPLPVLIAAALLQAALLLLTALYVRRYRRTYLSAMSFKEGFDMLPTGLCFYAPGGMVKMVNYKMDSLFTQITGEKLSDAEAFFRNLSDCAYPCCISGGEEPIICLDDGTAYSFTHHTVTANGVQMHELTAADITALYNITKELEQKQKRIRLINRRLKALNSTVRYVIMEKELLRIKVRVHDELGQALLLSRRFLQQPDAVDEREMLSLWKRSFGLLLTEKQELWQKPYQVNLRRAELLGLRMEIHGKLPEEEHLIPVIDTALSVHMTNVIRHAEGTCAAVTITEQEQSYTLSFTNDGRPPVNGVRETGGLGNLRRITERIGGGMKIRTLPAYELILKLPKIQKEHIT